MFKEDADIDAILKIVEENPAELDQLTISQLELLDEYLTDYKKYLSEQRRG